MRHDQSFTISQLAQGVGVNVETIRYYERIGLLRQPRKPARGWRRYDEGSLRRLQFIRRAQRLGFTLDEIKELLSLRESASPRTCDRVSRKAKTKLEEIEAKISDLQAMWEVLEQLAAACPKEDARACPILDALDVNEAHRAQPSRVSS